MSVSTVPNDVGESHRIAVAARECLHNSPHRSLRQVLCACDHGVLVLSGCLSSYYSKQVAQEAVARLQGLSQVLNEIEVVHRKDSEEILSPS